MVERVDYSEESTERKLEIARRRRDEAAAEIDLAKAKHGDWNEYAEALEAIQEMEKRLGIRRPVALGQPASERKHADVTLIDALLVHAYDEPTGEIFHAAAMEWLERRDVAATKQGVNSTLAHRKVLFRRVERGRYVLTAAGRARASELASGPLGTRLSIVQVVASNFERAVNAYQFAINAGRGS